jgi:hypothetical protein
MFPLIVLVPGIIVFPAAWAIVRKKDSLQKSQNNSINNSDKQCCTQHSPFASSSHIH